MMLQCSKTEAIMPRERKTGPATHPTTSSFLTLLSGWVQQGVESFFATQRILVDVAMRQNALAMKSLREGLSDPQHSPVANLAELALEGTSSFMEAQRILLNLAQQENDIILNGVKERVAGSAPASAVTDLMRRTIDTFLGMQHDFLKTTRKHTLDWLESAQKGKYGVMPMADIAREAMDTFIHAQKKFLDVVAQETARLTTAKEKPVKGMRKIELTKLAREASDAFIDAQKKLLDVVGQQMNVNLKVATRTIESMSPWRLLPMANITGDGVRSFIDAEKTMIESMVRPPRHIAERRTKRTPRHRKAAMAQAAHAVA